MQMESLLNALTDLKWPIALVVIAVLLKTPLSKLLVLISKIKYKGLEIFFNNKMDAIRSEIPPEELEIDEKNALESSVGGEISDLSPLNRISESWSATEEMVLEKLTDLLPPDNPDRQNLSKNRAMTLLSISGALTPSEQGTLEDLSDFINDLKRSPEDPVTESMGIKFRELNTYIQKKVFH